MQGFNATATATAACPTPAFRLHDATALLNSHIPAVAAAATAAVATTADPSGAEPHMPAVSAIKDFVVSSLKERANKEANKAINELGSSVVTWARNRFAGAFTVPVPTLAAALASREHQEETEVKPEEPAKPAICAPSPPSGSSRKGSWTYMRGVSLALSELCQETSHVGAPIPLTAIFERSTYHLPCVLHVLIPCHPVRQHQSVLGVLLGPHVEKDVPKRLIQLANEKVIVFDPFKQHVIVPEETQQKCVLCSLTRELTAGFGFRYAWKRTELLASGVDPADLRVYGPALTKGLSPSKRVTNAAVEDYKDQFRLRYGEKRAVRREESLVSIADAVFPAGPPAQDDDDEPFERHVHRTTRGQSILVDMAYALDKPGDAQEGLVAGVSAGVARRGYSVMSDMSAIIHHRDELQAENHRLGVKLRFD
ncbi:hypothetical protein BC834DRAFT_363516 [Gloeopeniophorella convolvens]|nr:hypothetical protein BC834DRAFT_363516 [Gloeopeniophorella convolvens]